MTANSNRKRKRFSEDDMDGEDGNSSQVGARFSGLPGRIVLSGRIYKEMIAGVSWLHLCVLMPFTFLSMRVSSGSEQAF